MKIAPPYWLIFHAPSLTRIQIEILSSRKKERQSGFPQIKQGRARLTRRKMVEVDIDLAWLPAASFLTAEARRSSAQHLRISHSGLYAVGLIVIIITVSTTGQEEDLHVH